MGDSSRGSQFGQNEVYHTLSYNIPHLNTWIDEVIELTEKQLPAKLNPTTEDLIESVYRYDACFREMLRQTNTFSIDLTRIYAKLWIGVLSLLDSMVKIYHRHVTQTASLQEQARELIHQRQAQVAATKIKQEEDILERTALRATIRNLEGEIESIRSINRELDRENRGLRALVETYIDARDFDSSLLNLVSNNQENLKEKAKKMNALESSRLHVDSLNRLDVEINEILSSIQTEEDRQLAILSQFDELLSSNEDMLTYFKSQHDQKEENISTSKEIGIQVDEKDTFGLVDDLGDIGNEDVPEFPPGMLTIPTLLTKNASTVPYELRKLMSTFPHVLRIPSLEWTKQSILAIYFSKIRNDIKFQKILIPEGKKTLSSYIHEYYTSQYGIPLVADMQIMVLLRACMLYASTSKRVWLFSEQIGLAEPEKQPQFGIRDTDLIMTIIASLQEQGELQPIQPSNSITKFKNNGDKSTDYTPSIVTSNNNNSNSGNNNSNSGNNGNNNSGSNINDESSLSGNPNIIAPYIKRSAGLCAAQNIFEKWLPDGGNEYLMKIRAMPNSKGSFHIDFDDFMEITMEQWLIVKGMWIEHLACLYHYNSSIFRVISEAQFATETGNPDRDTVLAQIIRDPTNVLTTRPTRLFNEAALGAAAAAARKAELYEKNQREFLRFKDEGINTIKTESIPLKKQTSNLNNSNNGNNNGNSNGSNGNGNNKDKDKDNTNKDTKNNGNDNNEFDDNYEINNQLGGIVEKDEKISKKENIPAPVNTTITNVTDTIQGGSGVKESVVDLMSKKSFVGALRNLKPDLSVSEINKYFKAAQELGYEITKRQLEAMWITFQHPTENRIVYYNRVTEHCQWTCPYRLKTFEAHDIDENTFIEIMLRYQIIDKSPLLEYFHVTPSDLWPNTEVFYRELELSKRRENVKRKQALNGKKKTMNNQKDKVDITTSPPVVM